MTDPNKPNIFPSTGKPFTDFSNPNTAGPSTLFSNNPTNNKNQSPASGKESQPKYSFGNILANSGSLYPKTNLANSQSFTSKGQNKKQGSVQESNKPTQNPFAPPKINQGSLKQTQKKFESNAPNPFSSFQKTSKTNPFENTSQNKNQELQKKETKIQDKEPIPRKQQIKLRQAKPENKIKQEKPTNPILQKKEMKVVPLSQLQIDMSEQEVRQEIIFRNENKQDVENLIEMIIQEYQCMFGSSFDVEKKPISEMFEEIIYKLQKEIDDEQSLFRQFSLNLENFVHQQSGHSENLESTLSKFLGTFQKQRTNQANKKAKLMKKYDMLLQKHKDLLKNYKNMEKDFIKLTTQNENLQDKLQAKQDQNQEMTRNLQEKIKLVKNLQQKLKTDEMTIRDCQNMIKSMSESKKISDKNFSLKMTEIISKTNETIEKVIKQKVEELEEENQETKAQKQKYKAWFQKLVDDISRNIDYKKTERVTYEEWMERYTKTSSTILKYGHGFYREDQKDRMKLQKTVGDKPKNGLASMEDKYKQLKQRYNRLS